MRRVVSRSVFVFTLFAILAVSVFGQTVSSPGGDLQLMFKLSSTGEPKYSLSYKGLAVIKDSKLGLRADSVVFLHSCTLYLQGCRYAT